MHFLNENFSEIEYSGKIVQHCYIMFMFWMLIWHWQQCVLFHAHCQLQPKHSGRPIKLQWDSVWLDDQAEFVSINRANSNTVPNCYFKKLNKAIRELFYRQPNKLAKQRNWQLKKHQKRIFSILLLWTSFGIFINFQYWAAVENVVSDFFCLSYTKQRNGKITNEMFNNQILSKIFVDCCHRRSTDSQIILTSKQELN